MGFRPPYSSSTSERTGQASGLKTTIGVTPGSFAISISWLSDWIATFSTRAATDVASPSWSRASSYAGSIAVPQIVSWNWLNRTCLHARPNSSRGIATRPDDAGDGRPRLGRDEPVLGPADPRLDPRMRGVTADGVVLEVVRSRPGCRRPTREPCRRTAVACSGAAAASHRPRRACGCSRGSRASVRRRGSRRRRRPSSRSSGRGQLGDRLVDVVARSSRGEQYSCGRRYVSTREPSADSHQKTGPGRRNLVGPGRMKT